MSVPARSGWIVPEKRGSARGESVFPVKDIYKWGEIGERYTYKLFVEWRPSNPLNWRFEVELDRCENSSEITLRLLDQDLVDLNLDLKSIPKEKSHSLSIEAHIEDGCRIAVEVGYLDGTDFGESNLEFLTL